MPWSSLSSAVIQTFSREILMFPECPDKWNISDYTYYKNNCTEAQQLRLPPSLQMQMKVGTKEMMMQCGEVFRELIKNWEMMPHFCHCHAWFTSPIFLSLLIFHPSHAVPTGIALHMFDRTLFLLNFSDFKLFHPNACFQLSTLLAL